MKRPVKKTLLILAIVLVCACIIIASPVRLGLDLRGGVSFVLRVNLQDALNAEAANVAERLKKELQNSHAAYSAVEVTEARIRVTGAQQAPPPVPGWKMARVTDGYILTLTPAAQATLERDVFAQTRRVIERRINAYGLSETPIQTYGSRGDELLVQLPDARDPERIKRALESRTVLAWYAVEDGPYASSADAMARHGGVLPLGTKLAPAAPASGALGQRPGQSAWYLLTTPPVIRGADLRDARVSAGDGSQPVTTFTLSQEAAARFERYTRANVGRRAAIVLDDQILTVPVIEDVIRDSGQIRGAHSLDEAEDLASNLRSGSLPAGVETIREQTVAPSLGADSIQHGVRAAAVGLAGVVGAMLLYYRRAGANAVLALLLNGVLLLAALACFGAVLTLPGIAGAILTIGMAVDSNVLIFERIREELRGGKGVRAAVAAGFSKAFSTLVDTHVTTVVSCAFLFLFGAPAVKGFAVTLVLGLVTNLFTSVFVSRVAFDWELSRRGVGAKLSI